MKKILLVIFCFALITKAIGQTADRIELDKIYQHINRAAISTGYLNDYGAAFLNKVRYNGLMTDSNFIPNMNVFRLTLNDLLSAKINPTAPSLPSVVSVNSTIEPMLYNTATPLIFNISQYDTIKEMAVINNLLSFSNGSYYDVAGRSQSPYSTVRFFAACPVNEDASATGTITLTYNSSLVYSNCGKQISSVGIDFGFGAGYQTLTSGGTISKTYTDSTGYKAFGIKVTCTDGSVYECISAQYVTVPLLGARYAASNISLLAQFNTTTAPINAGYATVVYSRLRQGTPLENKLVKPLIVVEGLDENDLLKTPTNFFMGSVSAGNKNMRTLLDDWDKLGQSSSYDFNGQLDDIAGYDLVYIDYYTLRKIEDNADMLIGLLNQINALQVNNASGVKEQNVVLGIELGGLVARYALAKMTKANIATQPTNCRLLITHDAPHQGAYMPLGYQHLVEDLENVTVGLSSFRNLMSDFRKFNVLKNSPVFNQMYLQTVNSDVFTYSTATFMRLGNGKVVYNDFMLPSNTDPNSYNKVVDLTGFTPSYQFVATSQGSQCGTAVIAPGTNMMKFEDEVLSINIFEASKKLGKIKFKIGFIPVWIDLKLKLAIDEVYKLKLNVNALPTAGNSNEISKVQLDRILKLKTKFVACPYTFICLNVASFSLVQIPITTYFAKRNSPSNILPYESFAGGTDEIENSRFLLPNFFKLVTVDGMFTFKSSQSTPGLIYFSNATYSKISRVSALDIENPVLTDYSKLLVVPVSGLNRSRATKFLCHEANNNGGITLFNVSSGRFTKRNATWIFNEMEGIANTDYCISECPITYTIVGDELVCNSKIFSLLQTPPTGTVVNWSVTPSTMATLSPTIGNQTTLTRLGNGFITLTATVQSGCSNNIASKMVYAGVLYAPTEMNFNGNFYTDNTQNLCLNRITNYEISVTPVAGAIAYNWSIGDPNAVSFNSGQGSNTINATVYGPPGSSLSFALQAVNECGAGYPIQVNGEVCGFELESRFSTIPNPTTGDIIIEVNSEEKNTNIKEIQVADKFGNIKKIIKVPNASKKYKINIAALPADVYIINLYDGKKWWSKKVIKK